MNSSLAIFGLDVGGGSRAAWVASDRPMRASSDLHELGHALADRLANGVPAILVVEAPLFIPLPLDQQRINRARQGECSPETGNRPFSAGAGASALITALGNMAIPLRIVKARMPNATATVRPEEFVAGRATLLIVEALISGSEKASSHADDARLAMLACAEAVVDLRAASRVTCGDPFCLAAAVILREGLSSDLTMLRERCVVLRPPRKIAVPEVATIE